MTSAVLEAILMPSFFSPGRQQQRNYPRNYVQIFRLCYKVKKIHLCERTYGLKSNVSRNASYIVLTSVMLIARAAAAQEMSLRAVYNPLSEDLADPLDRHYTLDAAGNHRAHRRPKKGGE